MAKIKDLDDLDTSEKTNKFIAAADMSKGKRNKGGRPKKDASERASEQIFINVTPGAVSYTHLTLPTSIVV